MALRACVTCHGSAPRGGELRLLTDPKSLDFRNDLSERVPAPCSPRCRVERGRANSTHSGAPGMVLPPPAIRGHRFSVRFAQVVSADPLFTRSSTTFDPVSSPERR